MSGRPRWQKLCALALLLAAAGCVAVFWPRLEPDFWPPDRSFIGPNLLAAAIGLAFGYLWGRAKLKQLHARHAQHTEHLDRLGRSLIEMHEKLDHLTKEKP